MFHRPVSLTHVRCVAPRSARGRRRLLTEANASLRTARFWTYVGRQKLSLPVYHAHRGMAPDRKTCYVVWTERSRPVYIRLGARVDELTWLEPVVSATVARSRRHEQYDEPLEVREVLQPEFVGEGQAITFVLHDPTAIYVDLRVETPGWLRNRLRVELVMHEGDIPQGRPAGNELLGRMWYENRNDRPE